MTIPQKKSFTIGQLIQNNSKTKTNQNVYLKAWVLEHAFINPHDCQEHNWRQVIDPSQETSLTTQMYHLFAMWDLAKTLNFSEPQIPPGYIFF